MNEMSVAEHPISVRSHGAHLLDLPRHYQRKSPSTFSTNLHLLFLTLRPLWSISDAFRRSLDFHSVEITEVINVEINKVPLVSLCKSCQRLLSIVSATQKWLCEKHSAIFVLVLSKSLFLQNLSNHTSLQSLGSTETKLFNNS